MGEARQRARREAAQRARFGTIDFPRVAAAVRSLMAAAPPGQEADAFAHAELARQLLLSEGLDAEVVVGFAAWRVGPGEGDIVIQGSGRATAAAEQSETGNEHAHHAWLETGGHVFDVTTYQLARKAAGLDQRDGKTTNVTWCPDFVLVPRDELSSFARVRQEVAGRMYYERDAYLQTVVASRIRAGGHPDLEMARITYRELGEDSPPAHRKTP
jgi:hypothetical protein